MQPLDSGIWNPFNPDHEYFTDLATTPFILWSAHVPCFQAKPISELNQWRNPKKQEEHLVRRVYCDPTRGDGSRVIRYFVDRVDVVLRLPRSTYMRSLDELLPPEVYRAPWMKLTRHPLVWDGITRLGASWLGV